jgi:uncharacterized membrane protein YphA (DoxX/SURF4 family)
MARGHERHSNERGKAVPAQTETRLPPNQVAGPTLPRPGVGARVVTWVAQVVVAVVLAQTLFFKFTYAPETQVIFAGRGGRPAATAVGIVELLCVALLLIPRTAVFGAALALLVISGAIVTHLTSLGIQIVDPATGQGDGGLLFGLAVVVAVGSAVVLVLRRREVPFLGRLLRGS